MTTKMQKLSEWTTKQLATAASVGFATLVGWVLFELLKGTELRAIAASAAGAVDFVAYQVASAGPITSVSRSSRSAASPSAVWGAKAYSPTASG